MNKVNTCPNKNYFQRNGFVMVSNLLIDYQQELEITDLELVFLIKIMKNRNGYVIHDEDIDPTVSTKTLSRRRTELKNKGLLNYSIIKKQDPNTGKFVTEGISYDLSQLEDKLQKISDKIEETKVEEVTKEIEEKHEVIEPVVKDEEDTPITYYKNEYEKYTGKPCKITQWELNYYNKLSDEEKEMVYHIMDFANDEDLLDKIDPKLSLFFKTPFRMEQLKKYCEDKRYPLNFKQFSEEKKPVYKDRLEAFLNGDFGEEETITDFSNDDWKKKPISEMTDEEIDRLTSEEKVKKFVEEQMSNIGE